MTDEQDKKDKQDKQEQNKMLPKSARKGRKKSAFRMNLPTPTLQKIDRNIVQIFDLLKKSGSELLEAYQHYTDKKYDKAVTCALAVAKTSLQMDSQLSFRQGFVFCFIEQALKEDYTRELGDDFDEKGVFDVSCGIHASRSLVMGAPIR